VNALDDVLAQFAAELGLGPFARDGDAPAVFRFERSGRLFVERRGERILVYLEGAEPVRGGGPLVAALTACAVGRQRDQTVRAGLTGDDRLVFGVRFGDDEFTLQALHRALDLLITAHAEVGRRATSP
jgi:type III secretion system chaperone SycN